MKISKYLHSCLLFEHEGEKLLFDPGKYSFIVPGYRLSCSPDYPVQE